MATQLTQIEDEERGKTILRVEGSLMLDDALLLEKIALNLRAEIERNLTIDLADLHFLDSESAPVIKRLEREHNFEIEGMHIFLQKILSEAEKKNA